MPFKWEINSYVLWNVHPVNLEVYYTELVGPNSWESTFAIFNVLPIEGLTLVYTCSVGDNDINEGKYEVLDWNQQIPKSYVITTKMQDEEIVEVNYSYKVQLRTVDEDVFLRYFGGSFADLEDLMGGPYGVINKNGFICISN